MANRFGEIKILYSHFGNYTCTRFHAACSSILDHRLDHTANFLAKWCYQVMIANFIITEISFIATQRNHFCTNMFLLFSLICFLASHIDMKLAMSLTFHYVPTEHAASLVYRLFTGVTSTAAGWSETVGHMIWSYQDNMQGEVLYHSDHETHMSIIERSYHMSRGPFYWYNITSIPAWISNYMLD